MSEITQPVHIWYGESDQAWVSMTADYLVANVPNVSLVKYPSEAHLFPVPLGKNAHCTALTRRGNSPTVVVVGVATRLRVGIGCAA